MDRISAIAAFSALAQDTRLTALRYLLSHSPEGKNAGQVARHCKVPHNTMSTHLAILERSGLVNSERSGREVIYAADVSGLRAVVDFLAKGCCGGRPEICGEIFSGAFCLPVSRVERSRE